ncbi:MAG TPA: cytochrome b/b6 domain-containing protein [Candidatus Acidoferrum sp.]|nr:cytochrome b/b6 domain-containing protein [Candidatus Acidoferrum sp.]
MKTPAGKSVSIDPAKHAAGVHGILACQDCHTKIKEYPHPAKIEKVQCATCHPDEASNFPNSIHGVIGAATCQTCHGDPHDVQTAAGIAPGKCAECHAQEVKAFASSIHGHAAASGDPDAPKCVSCHGPVHQIRASGDPASTVAKKNLPDTCATCHSKVEFLSRHNIPFAHPVELYKLSVHGRAVAAGNNAAATCSDCHGSHDIVPSRDPHSKINHWNVATTCGTCHAEISKTYLDSIHGQAMKAGAADAPVCTDCHGEHLILGPKEAASTVNASRVSSATCGRCHGDERLAVRFNMPSDRVPSYADSYHGLALREGSQTVANCASCHGVHNIFPSSDPRSTVNPANIRATCGACHAGAGESFAIGPVHVQASNGTAHPVVQWIRRIYWVLIPLTLGFMVLHNLIDLFSKLIRRRPRRETGRQVQRMNLSFRIAHWGVVLSFPVLVFTGFALKFPDSWWSWPLSHWRGHSNFRGDLHRVAAIVLLASVIYHAIHLSLNRRDRALLKAMLPQWKDLTDMFQVFAFNLGLSKTKPTFGKFNYAEKLEYLAFIWGSFIMAISGFLLWFNNFTLRHFPKWVADAATAIHYYEALLATFSILLWHFYIVIFDPVVYPMDAAWLTGKASADHFRHSRPAYFRKLEQEGLVDPPETDKDGSDGDDGAEE